MRSKKDIEFLELKQGNLTVVEYAAKFEELVKFWSHYSSVAVEVRSELSLKVGCVSRSNRILRMADPNLLATRVLVKRKGRNSFEESCM